MADRYHDSYWPKVQTCPSCGMTARPVHHDSPPSDNLPDKVFCPFCGAAMPFETCKPTHYDQIQQMSVEEMANVLSWISARKTADGWLDWLKQEVT